MTKRELARELGLSPDQVKRRLAILRELGLDSWARTAPGGALDLPPEIVDVLKRSLEHERAGHPMAEALRLALDQAPVAPNLAPRAPDPEGHSYPAPPESDPAVLRVLWTLTAVLGVALAGFLAAVWFVVLTR